MILHKGNQKVIKSNQREKLKTTNLRWLWRFFEGVRFPYGLLYLFKNFFKKGQETFLFLWKIS